MSAEYTQRHVAVVPRFRSSRVVLALVAASMTRVLRRFAGVLLALLPATIFAYLATLVERVRRRDHRPLLKDKDPATVLSALAAVRNPVYAEAPIRVNSRQAPHETTVAAIVAALAAANSARPVA